MKLVNTINPDYEDPEYVLEILVEAGITCVCRVCANRACTDCVYEHENLEPDGGYCTNYAPFEEANMSEIMELLLTQKAA